MTPTEHFALNKTYLIYVIPRKLDSIIILVSKKFKNLPDFYWPSVINGLTPDSAITI